MNNQEIKPHGKFEFEAFKFEATVSFPKREAISPEVVREILTRLREEGIITSEIEREIINRLEAGETLREILTHLKEEGIITPKAERLIISYLTERGIIAAEVPPKPFPWSWVVAAGSLLISGIMCLSTKKHQKEKND